MKPYSFRMNLAMGFTKWASLETFKQWDLSETKHPLSSMRSLSLRSPLFDEFKNLLFIQSAETLLDLCPR